MENTLAILIMLIVILSIDLSLPAEARCSNGKCQIGKACSVNKDCAAGLHCETCVAEGKLSPKCTRIRVTNPLAQVGGLPFNRYSWLTTHNSFAVLGEKSHTGAPRLTFYNQQDSVRDQLNNGVRGLMLDMYDFRGDVWLCHSFGGICYDFTAFEPAIDTLRVIEAFLRGNPREIVTIMVEDYVRAKDGLSKVLRAAGLGKYLFPVSRMPKNGEDWPTVTDMASKNQRLLVFTSNSSKEKSEGIAHQWRYMVENQYGDNGMKAGACPKRSESAPLITKSRSLVLENFFPTNPNLPNACKVNSAKLSDMLSVCYKAAGKRWANFLAVDFYKRSDGGGAPAAVDRLNGELMCGCSRLDYCESNSAFGVCKIGGGVKAANATEKSWGVTVAFDLAIAMLLQFFLLVFIYL